MESNQKKILIAGGSGYLGQKLADFYRSKGHEVMILSRVKKGKSSLQWDPEKNTIDEEALAWPNVLINLSGQSIGEMRWTQKRKEQLLRSRTISTAFLVQLLNQGRFSSVDLFINASATGYYPVGKDPRSEESIAGTSFQSSLVEKWEKELTGLKATVRTVIPRIAFVVAKDSEGVKKMALPVKLGIGSPLGRGDQIVPWIHLQDLLRAFEFFLNDSRVSGPVNLSHPVQISNREFLRSFARHYKRPFFFPNVPSWILKLVLGEMSTLALDSISVSSQKILKLGFKFQFPDLDSALAESN